MTFSLFDLLVVIGIILGLFTGLLLLFSKNNHPASRFLAFTLFTFILLSCRILLHTLDLWNIPNLRYFPLAFNLALPSLIYLYIRSTVNPGNRFKTRYILHFLPFVLFFAYTIVIYANVLSTADLAEKDSMANLLYFNLIMKWEDYILIVASWLYWSWSYVKLKEYRLWLIHNMADLSYPTYTWLRNVLIILGILIFNFTINILADVLEVDRDKFYHWQIFYLILAATIYYMGFKGYRLPALPATFSKSKIVYEGQPLPENENLNVAKEKILDALVVEKIYTDPEISLLKLAQRLQLSPGLVSYTINKVFRKNFRNLMNEYRVNEVKKRLIDPKANHRSVLRLALDCGFNSETNFYRLFKKATGQSPKEFMDANSF